MASRATHLTIPVQNTLDAYRVLQTEVERALHTQIGDAARLLYHRRRCIDVLNTAHQVDNYACRFLAS